MYEKLRSVVGITTLFVLFLFLSLGNLSRLLENHFFSDHILLSEVLLYLFSFLSLVFYPLSSSAARLLLFLSCFIALSFSYGALLQGADLLAGLYAARLICLMLTCFTLTEICWRIFSQSIPRFFSFLCLAYLTAAILGFCLYVFFPFSRHLWMFLQDFHISFQGDPHQGRFVSIYFDPNYYACIAGLLVLVSSYLRITTEKKRYTVYTWLFLISCLLTWSRSGIATMIFLLCFPRKGNYKKLFGLFVVFLAVSFFSWEEVQVFIERSFSVLEEDSALSRAKTFQYGFSLWKEHPLFGIGVNFLPFYTQEEFGLKSLDSSLLSVLVQIGALPFLGILGFFFLKGISLSSKERLWRQKEKDSRFFACFYFYCLLILLFSSQFNNILFYPFWLIPTCLVGGFLHRHTVRCLAFS